MMMQHAPGTLLELEVDSRSGSSCCICTCDEIGQALYACPFCYNACGVDKRDLNVMHPTCFAQWKAKTCPSCRRSVCLADEENVLLRAALVASLAYARVDPAEMMMLTDEEEEEQIQLAISRSRSRAFDEFPVDAHAVSSAPVSLALPPVPPRVRVSGVRRCRKCSGHPLLLGHACPLRKTKTSIAAGLDL